MSFDRAKLVVLLAVLGGCAGELENPSRFDEQADLCLTIDVEADIFGSNTCGNSVCHDADSPTAGLDLVSPGLAERLVDVPSQTCADRVLVDSADSEAGYLLEVLNPSPSCGNQMPLGQSALSDQEVTCIRLWLEEL